MSPHYGPRAHVSPSPRTVHVPIDSVSSARIPNHNRRTEKLPPPSDDFLFQIFGDQIVRASCCPKQFAVILINIR